MTRSLLGPLLLLALAGAGPIQAQPGPEHPLEPDRVGITLGIGGGLGQFLDGDGAKLGGFWEVRAAFGSRRLVSGEVAYVGSTRSFGGSGVDAGPKLLGNGLEGALRFQVPLLSGDWFISPFAFVGLGWTHVSITGSTIAGPLTAWSDDVAMVPLGAGLSFVRSGLVLQGRFTWHQPFEQHLTAPDGTQASLRSWSLVGLLGYEF